MLSLTKLLAINRSEVDSAELLSGKSIGMLLDFAVIAKILGLDRVLCRLKVGIAGLIAPSDAPDAMEGSVTWFDQGSVELEANAWLTRK